MSVRPSSKDQYEPPLGSQHTGSIRSSMTPPTVSNVQKVEQRPSTLAQIVQNPLKPQNPLVPVQNRYTHLYYQNNLITPSNLQKATSSSILAQESPYQEKPDLIPITVIEKEWKSTSPRDLAQQIFPLPFTIYLMTLKRPEPFMNSSQQTPTQQK